jgi:hypothetical protein
LEIDPQVAADLPAVFFELAAEGVGAHLPLGSALWVEHDGADGQVSNLIRLQTQKRPRSDPRAFEAFCPCQRREDFFLAFFLPGIIFFTALPVARAAFVTAFAAREAVDLFFAFLAIITSWIWTS